MTYIGVEVSGTFRARWRGKAHVGPAKPFEAVYVRRGFLNRFFHRWPGDQFGEIAGRGANQPMWFPDWTPTEDYSEIPTVKESRVEQSFENNGVATLTVDIDNIKYKEQNGPGGLYHLIASGYYSPLRGFSAFFRPPAPDPMNEWFQKMENAQITVVQGYGDATYKTFTGLIDDIDIEAKPDTMTVTARSFGGVLVDEHFFGWAMERGIRDPIVFVPRDQAYNNTKIYGPVKASSSASGHPARFAVDKGRKGTQTAWRSGQRSNPDNIEWIEMKVPVGTYSSIYVAPEYDNMEVFIGIWVEPRGRKKLVPGIYDPLGPTDAFYLDNASVLDIRGYRHSQEDGKNIPFGWLKFNPVNPGQTVPQKAGDNDGGWPYAIHRNRVRKAPHRIDFGFAVDMGPNSKIRVGFRRLARTGERASDNSPIYRAGLKAFYANRRLQTKDAKKNRWIIIDDVVEIVMCCLRWAGFKDWEVEFSGVNLKHKLVVNKANSFMDIINKVRDQLGYVFFVAEPDQNDDLSIGTPVFRMNSVFVPDRIAESDQVTHDDLLTDAQVKFTNRQDRSVIRVRGAQINSRKELERAKKQGQTQFVTGGDLTKRYMFAYGPPWADRMAGVIKHLTHYEPGVKSYGQARAACYLIALQIALAKVTAIVEVPGTPHVGLDAFLSVIDRGTGINSKIYTTNRVITFTRGEDASFVTELGGSLIDTPDISAITLEWLGAIAAGAFDDG